MILVDTNIWSEALRPHPSPQVQRWAAVHSEKLWLSTVVLGELLSGVELMPDGRKKDALTGAYEQLTMRHRDRIAPFDLEAARQYGQVLALQISAGRNPGTADTQIAATALARGMALATRNTRHFENLGLELIDPGSWSE
jgi:predicted nucleic acid-binding protein